MKWLIAGIISFSFVCGLLTGGSESPVAGISITGIIGLSIAGFGWMSKNSSNSASTDTKLSKEEEKELTTRQMNMMGVILTVFSISFMAGTLTGHWWATSKQSKEFVWDCQSPPSSTFEALDWVLVNEKLLSLGYDEEQIQELYKIRLTERKKGDIYKSTENYSRLFNGIPQTKGSTKGLPTPP
jgi:hypothetical protein